MSVLADLGRNASAPTACRTLGVEHEQLFARSRRTDLKVCGGVRAGAFADGAAFEGHSHFSDPRDTKLSIERGTGQIGPPGGTM